MTTLATTKINVKEYEMNDSAGIGLYVGTYHKYNSGSLAGMWIDLSKCEDAEEFFAVCRELHADEYDPEFMMQDYQGFPQALYSECPDSEEIDKIIEYAKLTEDEQEMIDDFVDYYGWDGMDIDKVHDCCMGKYDNMEDFAENLFRDCYNIPDYLDNYIDWQAVARDLKCDYFQGENGYIFRNY